MSGSLVARPREPVRAQRQGSAVVLALRGRRPTRGTVAVVADRVGLQCPARVEREVLVDRRGDGAASVVPRVVRRPERVPLAEVVASPRRLRGADGVGRVILLGAVVRRARARVSVVRDRVGRPRHNRDVDARRGCSAAVGGVVAPDDALAGDRLVGRAPRHREGLRAQRGGGALVDALARRAARTGTALRGARGGAVVRAVLGLHLADHRDGGDGLVRAVGDRCVDYRAPVVGRDP